MKRPNISSEFESNSKWLYFLWSLFSLTYPKTTKGAFRFSWYLKNSRCVYYVSELKLTLFIAKIHRNKESLRIVYINTITANTTNQLFLPASFDICRLCCSNENWSTQQPTQTFLCSLNTVQAESFIKYYGLVNIIAHLVHFIGNCIPTTAILLVSTSSAVLFQLYVSVVNAWLSVILLQISKWIHKKIM